jgi:hypothetical protein
VRAFAESIARPCSSREHIGAFICWRNLLGGVFRSKSCEPFLEAPSRVYGVPGCHPSPQGMNMGIRMLRFLEFGQPTLHPRVDYVVVT